MILNTSIRLDARRLDHSPRINLFRYGSRLQVHGRKSFRSTRFNTGSLCSIQSSNFFPFRSSSSKGSFETPTNDLTLKATRSLLRPFRRHCQSLLAEDRFQCSVLRIIMFVIFVMNDDPRDSIGPLFDQIGPTSESFPTEENLICTQQSTGHCNDIDQTLKNARIDVEKVIRLQQLMSQFRRRHLELDNDHHRGDTRSSTYGFGIRQCVASLSASLILRQLIHCARFGADIWNGCSIAEHLEERESSSFRRRDPVTYTRVSPSSNERISIVFELFRSTQIQLQIDRQLNDRQQIISTVDTRIKHWMCCGGRCNCFRRRRSDVLHHFMRITDDQNDERIVLSSEQHVHLLEEEERLRNSVFMNRRFTSRIWMIRCCSQTSKPSMRTTSRVLIFRKASTALMM